MALPYGTWLILCYILIIICDIKTEAPTTIDNVDYDPDTIAPVTNGDNLEVNLPYAWGGHKVPNATVNKWKEWLKNYNDEKAKDKLDKTDEKHLTWPWTWFGMEGGHKALPQPPPWAYEPINVGLPHYCYLHPSQGSTPCSKKKVQRYAYNPYTDECVTFSYGGCYGNQNNFPNKTTCEKMCIKHWSK